jgi:hypothetical protein
MITITVKSDRYEASIEMPEGTEETLRKAHLLMGDPSAEAAAISRKLWIDTRKEFVNLAEAIWCEHNGRVQRELDDMYNAEVNAWNAGIEKAERRSRFRLITGDAA